MNDLARFDHLENRWSLLESMYFCLVVITTIGYGHTVPETGLGKTVCVIYAIFGIPLCLGSWKEYIRGFIACWRVPLGVQVIFLTNKSGLSNNRK